MKNIVLTATCKCSIWLILLEIITVADIIAYFCSFQYNKSQLSEYNFFYSSLKMCVSVCRELGMSNSQNVLRPGAASAYISGNV